MKHIMKFPLDTGKKERQEYDLLYSSLQEVGPSNLKSWRFWLLYIQLWASVLSWTLDLGYMGQDIDAKKTLQAKLKRSETGNIIETGQG